nr:uncharacterized protein LOC113808003 [Penaeus vannamei]
MAKGSAASPGHLMTEEGEGPAGGCPVRVKELPPGEEARLVTLGFKGYTGLVRTQPGGMLMKARYKEMAPRFYNFAFRPDDIVVMTYPKCGTTWMQEILWGMTHLDELDEADRLPITKRTYFIDSDALYQLEDQMKDRFLMERFRALCPSARPDRGILLQSCGAQPPHPSKPRIIKTHFPFSLYRPDLLDRCRVVYVCRNPKDACVSYHHHCRLINTYKFEGSFETFAGCFMAGDVFYGRFWDHVAAAWERRRQPSSALRLLRGPPAPGPATASETLAGLGSLRSFALRQRQLVTRIFISVRFAHWKALLRLDVRLVDTSSSLRLARGVHTLLSETTLAPSLLLPASLPPRVLSDVVPTAASSDPRALATIACPVVANSTLRRLSPRHSMVLSVKIGELYEGALGYQ